MGKLRATCCLILALCFNSQAQDASELAQKLHTNYDSCKQIILNLKEDEPYKLDDLFWLEMKLMQNMLQQESLDAADQYSGSLCKKYRDKIKESSAFINRGNLFYITGQHKKAIVCYDSSISIAQVNNNLTDLGKANNNKAGCLTELGDYKGALEANEASRKSFETLKDTVSVVNSYLVRGNIFFAQDILDEAIAAYEMGLEKLSHHDEILLKGNLLNNVGLILNEGKQWRKAITYLKKTASIYQSLNLTPKDAYTNLGEAYRHINLDSALFYYELSLEYVQENGTQEELYRSLTNVGLVKQDMGDKEEALSLYNEALNTIEDNFDYPKIAQLLINIANLETENKNYDRAKKMADLALEKSLERRELQHIQNSYAALSALSMAQKDYEQALIYDNLRDEYKDSVLNESTINAITQYEAKYQSALKDQKIIEERNQKLEALNNQKNAEAERKESDLVAANRQKWVFGLAGGILAIAFLALFFIQRNKRQAQAEKDAAIISERDRGLNAVIQAQEEERKRISKDLHDGIGQQLSGINLAWQNLSTKIGQKAPEEFNQLMTISSVLDDATVEVRNMSHQMMPRALQESGLAPAIEDMLRKSLQFSEIDYEFDHYNVDTRFKENVEVSLYRICQELINNVIKHSEANSVTIQLFKNQDKLILIVEDNGTGMKNGDPKGHGLLNIKSRLNTIQGTVNFEPSPQSGTIARIIIPIS